ncbi:MFS transporter [Pedomonas mirosovicensis]|uniref:MFS transporter n=1 Tax=Pedomonas mirosovicensis TaxID=2908641 RepID=UPI002167BB00|nr:MFS transporter [Pedomonas mirosovicensis]MCH8684423.1 MFS transporter [Pedomonas mirosovicensis]
MANAGPLKPRVSAALAMTARQRLVAVLLLGTNFMLSVDFSILNIALPEVGRAVGLNVANLPWVTTAFALPAAGLSLLFGRLGDLYGRRRMFLAGLTLLAVASLLGGISTGPFTLLAARSLQGTAAAMTAPAALSLLITTFADRRQRERVLGWNGMLLSAGFTVGALLGGTLVGMLSWRWAFLINVPVAILILALAPFLIAARGSSDRVPLDVPGAASVTLGLLALVFAITDRSLLALVAGMILLTLFILIEQRTTMPLIAIGMLARPAVRWGNLAALAIFSMEAGLIFLMTLYLQDVLHLPPSTAGLIFGVPGLASVAAGIVAGRIIGRHGARSVLLAALLVQGGLTAPLTLLGNAPIWLWLLVPALFVGFLGHITAVVAATVIATSQASEADAGLLTGLVTTSQRIAVTVGIPALGAVMGLSADLLTGIRVALAANAIFTAAAVVLIGLGLRGERLPAPAAAPDDTR